MPRLPLTTALALIIFSFTEIDAATETAADLEAGVRELAQQLSLSMSNASVHKVAIIDFSDLNGQTSALGQFLAEELTTQLFLVSPGRFEVVERRQLARVLDEQKLTMTGLIDASTLASVGKILGIEALVTGSITDLGNEVKINARLIGVETARVFAVSATRIPNVGTVKELISKHVPMTQAQAARTGISPTSATGGREWAGRALHAEAIALAVSEQQRRVTLSIRLENRSENPLFLAAAGRDAAGLTDDRGASARRAHVVGLPTLHAWNDESLLAGRVTAASIRKRRPS
jgi:TolB-like protein